MEVDFVSFAGLVDALGGITIDFPYPAQDTESGLFIPEPGPHELDGDMALAYVRSRHYQELKEDGEGHEDPTADLGRITRQQALLTTVFGKLSDTKNPFTLARAADGIATGLRIDDKMSFTDALRLGWGMRGIVPEPLDPLPVDNDRNEAGGRVLPRGGRGRPPLGSGGGGGGIVPEPLDPLPVDNDRNEAGAVLLLREDEAQPILDKIRYPNIPLGLRLPSGARACFTARIASTSAGDRSRASHAFLAVPIPCSALIERPRFTTRP